MRPLLLFILFYAVSCSTPKVLDRGPVAELLLRPRKEYPDMLTNRRCVAYKPRTSTCTSWDTKTFDLNDQAVRDLLRNLRFVCNVQGARFVPCPTARGLCQLTQEHSGFGPWAKTTTKLNKYISLHSDLDFLIAANTKCAAYNSAAGQHLFD